MLELQNKITERFEITFNLRLHNNKIRASEFKENFQHFVFSKNFKNIFKKFYIKEALYCSV